MATDCIFCKIVKREIPADIIFEDANFLVFKDLYPKADLHLLIIPKEHIASLDQIEKKHQELMGKMLLLIPQLAQDHHLTGYRTIINTGSSGGQEIFHSHCHLLAGKNLPGFK